MSYHDGAMPTYVFSFRIERGGCVLIDTAITVKANAGGIDKARETIQRLVDEYAPAIEPAQASVPKTENPTSIDPAGQPEPEAVSAPSFGKRPKGARGLLRLRCPECGKSFVTFLREYQAEIVCKCGHHIDLDVPLARYRFNCPYCEKESWGQTNLEDPEITIRCKCGGDVDLRWAPKAKEYQN